MSTSSLYPYDPNRALPIVSTVVITVLALSIFIQSWRARWWHFSFLMTWGSAIWIAGFVLRAISVAQPLNIPVFVGAYVLVFLGPPVYAAAEYFVLGRLLAYLPYHSPLHPGRVLSTFLIIGAVVESLAASSIATTASPNATAEDRASALDRVKASLLLQEVVELTFISMVALVEYRCRRAGHFPRNVRIVCRVLYVTSLMMTVRCAFRAAEGWEAADCPVGTAYCGVVATHEWFLWVFEVLNIAVLVTVLAIWHPGRFLPSSDKQYLDPNDGTTERLGPGYAKGDGRPWLVTVLDPFNFAAMMQGKPTVDPFWTKANPVAEKTFVRY